jgi:hypothetical protein
MEAKVYNINLEDFRTLGAKVFTTRPRGIEVREKSNIDSIEPLYDKINITIPTDISSINPSFLEEFFEHIVMKLGEEGFYKKFSFINDGRYKIETDLAEAVERILREENALA